MATITEQMSQATRTNLENQVGLMTSLSNKAFEGMQKLIDLNLQAARSTLDESTNVLRQLMSAKDPQEFLSVSNAQTQPNLEKAMSYTRHVATIASTTQAEMTKAAEEQLAETNRKVIGLVEQVSQSAPAGSENVVALMKSAINSANASYEQLSKTTKQAADAMQANVNNAVSQFSKAGQNIADTTQDNIQTATNAVQSAANTPAVSTRPEKQR